MNPNQMLVCEERGKLEFKGKNQSEQRTNTFNPHMKPRLGHIGGRQVLSPPHHPCSLRQTSQTAGDISAKLSKNAIEMELKTRNDNHVYHRTWDLVISRLTFEMEWNRGGNCKNFYHIRGKITECWLAETQGIFFLIKREWLFDPHWFKFA